MATYYVWSGATGLNNGTSWVNAYTTFAAGVAAATVNSDVILVHKTHLENLTANTTYTFLANVACLVVDKDAGNARAEMDYTTGGIIVADATIVLGGAKNVYLDGFCFAITGTLNRSITLCSTHAAAFNFGVVRAYQMSTNASSRIYLTTTNTNQRLYVNAQKLICAFGNAGQRVGASHPVEITEMIVNAAYTAPTTLFEGGAVTANSVLTVCGGDLSHVTGTILGDTTFSTRVFISNAKLAAGITPLAPQTLGNLSGGELYLYNCAAGDNHYNFSHHNALGETTVSASIYANDGAEYNTAAARYSWKIVTTANCTFYAPYVSPWVRKYNETVTAITPYLECMRDNSAGAVFQDNEVWAEFSHQGTAGFSQGVFVDDRMALLDTPANQAASSKTATDWTGETGTPGFFKIGPSASITPAVIGSLSARVCVGKPSSTVYVDPQIRT